MTAPDTAKLAELFERFEFKSWRRELNAASEAADATGPCAHDRARGARARLSSGTTKRY